MKNQKTKANKQKAPTAVRSSDLLAFVHVREAIGDPTGKLMQDEVVDVVRKLARLKYCADQLNTIVEGVKNKRWSADGCRLKDTMEWCDFYCALSEANGVVQCHCCGTIYDPRNSKPNHDDCCGQWPKHASNCNYATGN